MMKLNDTAFRSRVDTLEIKDHITNRDPYNYTDTQGIDEPRLDKEMNIKTKLNPNKFDCLEISNDYSLSTTIDKLAEMYNILNIVDTNKVNFNRIDIATDVDAKFDDISKLLALVHRCIRFKEDMGKSWHNVNDDTLKISNYYFKNHKIRIEFYNKNIESNGKSMYPTRMEIRFVRIYSKNFKLHMNNTINLWRDMPSNLEHVEEEMIKILKQLWLEEKSSNPNPSFTTFIHKYSDYIYTKKILNSLYECTNFKSPINRWLQEYRKKYSIEFYSKTDLQKFSAKVIRSLKDYLKS